VSDLNTAVDALSSATNAYGVEALSADEAADILFTGVRQGKTTIDELAATVSETAPIAASLGIGFDETTAALAAMTAQGEPSRKAATKLRQAMAELSDGTSGVGMVFADVAGESFPAFIEGGGTFQEALIMLAEHADSKGKRISDMFGSIEAGMAATMLTSDTGRETMAENMAGMEESVGSAEAAFAQMDQGIARTWERIVATGESFMTDIGQLLGPVITGVLEAALAGFTTFADNTIAFLTRIRDAWSGDMDNVGLTTNETVERVLSLASSLWAGVEAAFRAIAAVWAEVLKPAFDAIAPLVTMVFNTSLAVIEGAVNTITNVLNVLASLLRGDFSGAWDAMRDQVENVSNMIATIVESVWNGMSSFLDTITGGMTGIVANAWQTMSRNIEEAVENDRTFLSGAWDGITTLAEQRWPRTVNTVATAFDTMSRNITEAVENDRSFLSGAWDGITSLAEQAWPRTTAAITSAMDTMSRNITEAVENDRTWLSGAWDGITALAEERWPRTVAAVTGAFDTMSVMIEEAVENDRSYISGVWDGIAVLLDDVWQRIRANAVRIWDAIRAAIQDALTGLAGWAEGVFDEIVDAIGRTIGRVRARIEDALNAVRGLFRDADRAEARVEDVDRSLGDIDEELPGTRDPVAPDYDSGITLPDFDETIMTPDDLADRGGVPEFASGGVVMRDMLARVGEAGPEAVIPLDRLDRMIGGGTQTIIVELDGRRIAESTVRHAPSVLRLHGA